MLVENMKLKRTQMRMLMLMGAVRFQDRITNADLRNRFGIGCIGDVVRRNRLCCVGRVERKTEVDWVKKVLNLK